MNDRTVMARRRHELLTEVEHVATTVAHDLGLCPDRAQHIGAAVADAICEQWAGQQITFPKRGYVGLSPREEAIMAQHAEGVPVFRIAKQFEMTERGVRALIKRVSAGRKPKIDQLSLGI